MVKSSERRVRRLKEPEVEGAEVEADETAVLFGLRIREVRRRKRLTLRAVADAANVSESFLSQVERGLANPSVASLRRIGDAMDEPVASFFVGTPAPGMLVRKDSRRRMAHPLGGLEDSLLTPQSAKSLQMIYSVIAPGDGSGEEPYTHGGDEECVFVISGSLRVGLAEDYYDLGEGDSLLLDPSTPHSFRNPGSGPAVVIWVQTPPTF